MDYAKNEQQKKNLSVIRIPDTIVDRICAAGSTIMEVTSESFHECSVDADVVTDTGIAKIPSITNIRSHFYRKRYLLNTYADAMAFLALEKQHTYYMKQRRMKKFRTSWTHIFVFDTCF